MKAPRSGKLRSIGIAAAIAVGASLGVLAPAAMAAPPANDTFAERTQLGDELPVNLTESNAGATWDEGQSIALYGSDAGHSVWWEWEAPRSEVVSIGSCGSDFLTGLAVFTGASFPLQRVGGSQGPDCSAQTTFAAVAGEKYDIGVDGLFAIPGGTTPSAGVGTIALRIAALPPPPNDDFAEATTIKQEIWETPGGYRNLVDHPPAGYNWGGTSEPGEPVHAGVGGGASVWYRFTPPETGMVYLYLDWGSMIHPVAAVYTGSSLSALTPVAVAPNPGGSVSFPAAVGQEYRLAFDGLQTEGFPWMGTFKFSLGEMLAPGPGYAVDSPTSTTSAPTADKATEVPHSPRIRGRSIDPRTGSASFRFSSATRGVHFRCSLDRAPFHGCVSPLHLRHLHPGSHRLGIVSVLKGWPVSKPSVIHFAIAAAQRRPHAAG